LHTLGKVSDLRQALHIVVIHAYSHHLLRINKNRITFSQKRSFLDAFALESPHPSDAFCIGQGSPWHSCCLLIIIWHVINKEYLSYLPEH